MTVSAAALGFIIGLEEAALRRPQPGFELSLWKPGALWKIAQV